MDDRVTEKRQNPAESAQKVGPDRLGRQFRAGVVPFLPVRALIHGLDTGRAVDLIRTAPSRLKRLLANGELDAAFLSSIDLPCFGDRLTILQAGCVAASGPTLLAKIFSQVEAKNISVLWADRDSSSSVALVQVVWSKLFHRRISIIPFDPVPGQYPHDAEAILMIGDKVVTDPPIGFDRQLDPTAMWHEMTGLPFVFGVWATMHDSYCHPLYSILLAARQEGQRNLKKIASELAPAYGWPVDLATRCMMHELEFEFTDAHREGLEEFLEMAAECKLIDSPGPLKYHVP